MIHSFFLDKRCVPSRGCSLYASYSKPSTGQPANENGILAAIICFLAPHATASTGQPSLCQCFACILLSTAMQSETSYTDEKGERMSPETLRQLLRKAGSQEREALLRKLETNARQTFKVHKRKETRSKAIQRRNQGRQRCLYGVNPGHAGGLQK